jgi:hypothetical protein
MTMAIGNEWEETLRYAIGLARATKRRHSVYAYRLPSGRWGWDVRANGAAAGTQHPRSTPPEVEKVESRQDFDRIMGRFPRCAARSHIGRSKVALVCGEKLARRLASFLTKDGRPSHHYRCPLPAPAIGVHYHLATGKR